jgi:hypothetical protein
MGFGRFERRIPLSGDPVKVFGPFDPEDHKVEEADVLFLIIQGRGANSVVAKGMGIWKRGKNDDMWTGTVPVTGEKRKPDGRDGTLTQGVARGIALAVVVKAGELFEDEPLGEEEGPAQGGPVWIFDPPQVDGVTWCSNFLFE